MTKRGPTLPLGDANASAASSGTTTRREECLNWFDWTTTKDDTTALALAGLR
jgi:hypothetical protein